MPKSYKEAHPQRFTGMPKPKGIPQASWSRIEARVKAGCEKRGDELGWDRKRRDKCIYGSLNKIREEHERRS